jgi:hypothetical protein
MKKSIFLGGLFGGLSALGFGFLFSKHILVSHKEVVDSENVLVDGTIPREKAKKIFDRIASQYIKNVGKKYIDLIFLTLLSSVHFNIIVFRFARPRG